MEATEKSGEASS
jgi:hypothetical protein